MNIFNSMAESAINTLTFIINSFSGLLQLCIFMVLLVTFCFAAVKCYHSYLTLTYCPPRKIARKNLLSPSFNMKTPLAIIAASFFLKAKVHYLEEKDNDLSLDKIVPPDVYMKDAAFQYTEKYFEEKFLEPIDMMANLLPPIGFIGTIIGIAIHFLNSGGTINNGATVAGIGTALYTTLLALTGFTIIEYLKKNFYMLAQKRIDEGLLSASLIKNIPALKDVLKEKRDEH